MIEINGITRVVAGFVLTLPLLLTLDWVSGTVAVVLELIAAVAVLKISPALLAKRLLPLILISPIAAVSMLLYGRPSGETYWQWGLIQITEGSVTLSVASLIRVFALAVPAIVLFASADSTRIADGLEQIARLPARFVWGTLAGFRTIGLFRSDLQLLTLARRARGLGDQGRLRRFASLTFTLLVFALRRGTRLAVALEVRGLGAPIPRSHARKSRLTWRDGAFLVGCVAIVAVALWAALWAGTFWLVWS